MQTGSDGDSWLKNPTLLLPLLLTLILQIKQLLQGLFSFVSKSFVFYLEKPRLFLFFFGLISFFIFYSSVCRFCIIEGPETVQDFAKMELQEIQDNIRSRRNKIFLQMEEVSYHMLLFIYYILLLTSLFPKLSIPHNITRSLEISCCRFFFVFMI